MARVALRQLRWSRHAAFVEVTGGWVEIHAPGLLRGRTPWRIPVSQVAVVDPAQPEPARGGGMAPLAFVDPVTVRYLPTTSAWVGPNLTLLFATPVALPPGRLPRRKATVDGASLRADDPRSATETLAGVGVERTTTPLAWLAAHREMTTALHARASADARQSVDQQIRVGAALLVPVLAATAWWAEQARSGLVGAVFAVECVAAAALPAVLRRRDRA